MKQSFRLDDVSASGQIESPKVSRVARLDYANTKFARCDGVDGFCMGCDSAKLKRTQEDVYQYANAA